MPESSGLEGSLPTKSRLKTAVKLFLAAVGVFTVLVNGYVLWLFLGLQFDFIYYAEAREIEELAEAIPGVEVIEVDGSHDLTLQYLWLWARYYGTEVIFRGVSEEDFEDQACGPYLQRLGEWEFVHYGYDNAQAEAENRWSSFGEGISLGPQSDLAKLGGEASLLMSIPNFFENFHHARALLERIPEEYPGLRVVEDDGKVYHFRRTLARPTVADSEPK